MEHIVLTYLQCARFIKMLIDYNCTYTIYLQCNVDYRTIEYQSTVYGK